MDDAYLMVGCIDFGTDSYAISVPILQKQSSNYVYIPKTDHHFIVTDFYEIDDLRYQVHYLQATRTVRISEKSPVPILDGGSVYVVDPEWNASEIASRCPGLGIEALKAFVSLRERIAERSTAAAHSEVEAAIQNLLEEPVRSRYWVSKFSALVRSALESGEPSDGLLVAMENARLRWIEKYATKTSLKLVTQLMQVGGLELHADAAKKILLKRFEGLFNTKGIYISRAELIAYEEMFPSGILPAIRSDADGDYDYWRRGGEISKKVNDQIYRLIHFGYNGSRANSPERWSTSELERILRLFVVLGGDDHLLEQAAAYFLPLRQILLSDLAACTANRYDWPPALSGQANRRFVNNVCDLIDVPRFDRAPSREEWLRLIGAVIDAFQKLITLAKIVSPHLRHRSDQEIAFKELDHALLDALTQVLRTRKPEAINTILQPRLA